MSATAVLQSHQNLPSGAWQHACTASVRRWAAERGYAYVFMDDGIFDILPAGYRAKVGDRTPILTDLARLKYAQQLLEKYEVVVWLDADVLIWAPERLGDVSVADAQFGREFWVQQDRRGRWRTYRSLHNAFCAFRRGSVVLPFLEQTTRSIIGRADADHIAPQMVGPKLITALHNIAGFEVNERIGALSPAVVDDLQSGSGPALQRLLDTEGRRLAGANLCSSLHADRDLTALCAALVERGCISG